MSTRLLVSCLLLALAAAPALAIDEPQTSFQPTALEQALAAGTSDCLEASLTAEVPTGDEIALGENAFEDLAGTLDAQAGAENQAVCTPQTRTIYTCDCNISGTIRYRKRNQYRECCGIYCDPWTTTSSSCTNYPC
ncbi:MAG: hypothetical protein KDD47_27740 [Acidobacteria bacterium]|nr:hypothetical protein [Acidobacteriota bacterium]